MMVVMASFSWKKLELVVLLIYAAIFYALVIHRSIQLSTEYSRGSKGRLLWGLTQGFWTRLKDNSDSQWRNFRGNLSMLSIVMAVFLSTSIVARSFWHLSGRGMARFWILLSAAFILYLHGICIVFLLIIAGGNYILVKVLASRPWFPIILWVYNLIFLVSNRVYEGYPFSSFGESLAFLDHYRGVLRWHIGYNFVMLRMVSFAMDYHWAYMSRMSAVNWEKHNQNCDSCHKGVPCYMMRQERPLPLADYSIQFYLCYLFYPPLYVAGPIISFNAFTSQLQFPQKAFTVVYILLYGFRWIICFGLIEMMTHFCYYNSLARSGVWQTLSAWEIFVVGYGVLNFMWLKFLLIWRFFRFWALVGGIEVVENMPRCVNNCYDLEGFWKSWHASYNRWLVRYLYIPLGGSHWRVLNVWVVFTFVAVWHDLEWKLLSWAWISCLLMAPEVIIKTLMHSSKMHRFRSSLLYHELCAIFGALNISGLMVANIIGFVVGPQGTHWLLTRMLEKHNLSVIISILFSFYVGTKLMFHIRENDSKWKLKKQEE